MENGPFLINGTADPVYNPYGEGLRLHSNLWVVSGSSALLTGWNAVSNLLYVDQPAGTGFSYVTSPLGYETNERQIATELWDFIRQFYQLYPKYSNLDLYVFGESYGRPPSLSCCLLSPISTVPYPPKLTAGFILFFQLGTMFQQLARLLWRATPSMLRT